MTISKLILVSLHSKRVTLHADDPTKSKIFITQLLWWVKVVLTVFMKNLNLISNREISL